jgi:hypothetical protein
MRLWASRSSRAQAPDAPGFHRIEFEHYQPPQPVEALVACTSLHNVVDLDEVLDRVVAALDSGAPWRWWSGRGSASMRSPQAGALRGLDRWDRRRSRAGCSATGTNGSPLACPGRRTAGPGRHRGGCTPARRSCGGWDARFDRQLCEFGPYFFADLADHPGGRAGRDRRRADPGDRHRYAGRRR